jgi:hypothetical protein
MVNSGGIDSRVAVSDGETGGGVLLTGAAVQVENVIIEIMRKRASSHRLFIVRYRIWNLLRL